MKFPETYSCLRQNVFADGEYSIVPIRYEDRFKIMKWRNEQIYHLRQNKPLTEEDQENYFKNVVSQLFEQEKPSQILFSYLKNGEFIGYGGLVHINRTDRNAEISFIMDTALEQNEFAVHWTNWLKLIEKVAFDELQLHKIFTYAFDLRPHLYPVLENQGFSKEAVLKEHYLFDGIFRDVLIHTKINRTISLRSIEVEDLELVYHWSNDPLTRQNSFNSYPIPFENHKEWFSKKLQNNADYFITEVDGNPAGLIRFDENEGYTTIGVLIDKEYRGKKLAAYFLRQACEAYRKNNKNEIFAWIKADNIASVKSFEKANFNFIENCIVNGHNAVKYQYHD